MTETTTRLLRRLIDEPGHVEALRELAPPRFVALVRSVGLEDAGELMAMATPAQTLELLDAQLWTPAAELPTERLDAARVVVWLEVMLEAGDAAAARRLTQLPEELLTALVHGQVFVLGPEALGHDLAGADWDRAALAERVLDETLHIELEGYTLVARHELGWDPTLAALLALDAADHERVERVLRRCHQATREELAGASGEGSIEELETLLSAGETLELDALADRESRRAPRGYVSRADARAFLALADQTPVDAPEALAEDPVTRAYFRELEPDTAAAERARPPRRSSPTLASLVARAETEQMGAPPATPALRAGSRPSPETVALTRLREALHELAARSSARHGQQLARLAYLANVLLSASPSEDALTPVAASQLVLRCVAAGFEHLAGGASLDRVGVDALFRLGWRLTRKLHESSIAQR